VKNQNANQKLGSKVKVRPDFDRSMCGVTTGRASKAWHFLRRDIVQNKTKALVNKRCFENEFSKSYLSENESDLSFDSDTSYESDSEDRKLEPLPFQLAEKGWVSPSSLQFVGRKHLQGKPSPLPSVKEGLSIDILLESEIAMTRSNSTFTSPLATPNPDSVFVPSTSNKNCEDDPPESIFESLLDSIDTPMNIVTEDVSVKLTTQPTLIGSMLDQGLIDYFTNRPARFRRIKQKTLNRRNDEQHKKQKLIKKKAKQPSSYNGLCSLVTVLNRKKGHFVDSPKSSSLFDPQGYIWKKQDLPSFVTINTDKFTDTKVGFRQIKKNIDSFVNESKTKKVIKYKPAVESPSCFIDLSSYSRKMEHNTTCVSGATVEAEKESSEGVKELSNDSSEDEFLKVKPASEIKKKETILSKTTPNKIATKQPISNKTEGR